MEQEKSEPAKLVLINTFISCTSKGTSESDLGEMAQKIRNSRYNEKRFRALIIRKSNPQTTVLLFKSEKTLIFTSAPENSFPILAKTIEKEWQKVLNSKAIKITNLTVYVSLQHDGQILVGFQNRPRKTVRDGKGVQTRQHARSDAQNQ